MGPGNSLPSSHGYLQNECRPILKSEGDPSPFMNGRASSKHNPFKSKGMEKTFYRIFPPSSGLLSENGTRSKCRGSKLRRL